MGFEELAAELHRHAEAEGRKLKGASEREAEKIEAAAKEKADEAVKAAKKEATSYGKQEAAEKMTSAKLSAKKMVDEARDEAVEEALSQVWKQFRADALRKSAYPALLDRLVREGVRELGSKEAVVYVRDEDKGLVSGYKAASLPKEYSGGAIIESADGSVRVNKTLEEEFSQKKPAIRKQIYDKLF